MPETEHHYLSHGLRLVCDRPLIGGVESPLPPGAEPDVTVAFDDVPLDRLDGDRVAEEFAVRENGDIAACFRSARVAITGGRRIDVTPQRGASDAALGSMIFGLAVAGILHQRRTPPLHCCCVADERGALLLLGDSGAGKSTTALMFRDRGWRILAEDMVALDFDGPAVGAHPSTGVARFWKESWDGVSPDAAGEALDMGAFPKTTIALGDAGAGGPVPILAMYFLEWLHPAEGPAEVEAMTPMEALVGLRAAVYRPRLTTAMGREGDYLARLGRLAGQAPAFRLRRPRSFATTDWLDRLVSWADLDGAPAGDRGDVGERRAE